MRRWTMPLLAGAVLALLAGYATLAAVPRVLMRVAEARLAAPRGRNVMVFGPLVTAASRQVVRPSPDLLYASCSVDVGDGPVLVEVPPVDAPYWSLSVFDHLTNVAFVRNNAQSGGQAIRIAIIRDGQTPPPGYQPVAVGGRRGVALVRTLIDRAGSIDHADRQRRRATCRRA